MKKILVLLAALIGIAASQASFAQFNPSNGFQTITNTCGTYFLQGTTYYNGQGASLGTSLPFCVAPFSIQNSSSAIVIPAKYTNATLPACNATSSGLVAIESDGAATPVYAATATGSGTLSVEVLCTNSNGTYSWTNH
jgi:hypothetical protein